MSKFRYHIVLLLFLWVANTSALASFHKVLWLKWQINNPQSQATISHKKWQEFLNRHLKVTDEGIHVIDYPALTPKDYRLLQKYIHEMAKIPIEQYTRQEQLAFWLNVYNALTVQAVAHYYPISTIHEINISPGLFSTGPWGSALIKINGTMLSLDDIHNRIIRPIWNDPRTHYAINNGSIGAANLNAEAFNASKLNTQLNQAASQYINAPRGVQIVENKLIISKVYKWFLEDFGETECDVIKHLKFFAQRPLQTKLKKIHKISGYMYNWHLNTTAPKARLLK